MPWRLFAVSFVLLLVVLGVFVTPPRASSSTTSDFPSWNLMNVSLSSPSVGFGVFQRETTNGDNCQDYVGRTSDGGAHFASVVRAMTWNCSTTSFSSTLVFDDAGDGFLYGPRLFVTHDDGRTWAPSARDGRVLDVAAVGRSVWMVESACSSETRSACSAGQLWQSSDGGRTWALSPIPSVRVGFFPGTWSAASQTYLVRINRERAYLVGLPEQNNKGRDDAAPLLVTANGGATWSTRSVPCHLDAGSVVLAAAPNGALDAVCADEPSAGFQPKTALRSTDGGRTWALLAACKLAEDKGCSSPLDFGYLGAITAPAPESIFEVGGRTVLTASFDGGSTWRAIRPYIGEAGGTVQVVFFNADDGLVVVGFPSQLWVTTDGGASWHQRAITSP